MIKTYETENLQWLKDREAESIDLIYLDPPFFTQKDWGEYDDRWVSLGDYLKFIKWRLIECHRVLKDTGSIYVHCDWRVNAHIRLMMDEVFGVNNFVNEIIWSYGLGGSSNRSFSSKHDTIFFYSKTKDYYFSKPLVPATSQMMAGQMKGATDVFAIPSLNNMAKERLNYPTQKPEALLERIIKASSNEGDIVLDPFCGSGTTLAVAHRLKRNAIGLDNNKNAINITDKRVFARKQL